ncbi:MAG: hypothetical protein ACR2NU_11685 [Aeoliella sp.]
MPEFIFTSEASHARFASTMVAEGPAVFGISVCDLHASQLRSKVAARHFNWFRIKQCGIDMHGRIVAQVAGIILLIAAAASNSLAQEPHTEATKPPSQTAPSDPLGMGEMARAASDLRKAGEAFERFAVAGADLAKSITKSLAMMSSEFDPFGYKTAFRTVGQQAQMLHQQREIIQTLQEREIERLRRENTELQQKLRKARQRN